MPRVSTSRAARSRLAAAAACALLAACGARTGLRVRAGDAAAQPDATTARDGAPDDGALPARPDVPPRVDACVPGRFDLRPQPAEVVLLLDRSASMELPLSPTARRPTRYEALREALRATLPAFGDTIDMGALMFPNADECVVRLPLDVPVAPRAAARVVSVYAAAGLEIGTPTFDAVRLAAATLASSPGARPRALVLATDGGPVCNAALDGRACACLDGAGSTGGRACEPRFCLDDARTLGAIDAARRAGVPTYVIGIDDPSEPVLLTTLERMAQAGGRPRAGAPGYYGVRAPRDLTDAFTAIQRSIARCARVLPSRAEDPDAVTIAVNGDQVPRDPSRQNGWDWSGPALDEITLFGPACERLDERTVVTADVRCRGDGGG